MKHSFTIVSSDTKAGELTISGEISYEENSAASVIKALEAIEDAGNTKANIRLVNLHGGSVVEGIAIMEAIEDMATRVEVTMIVEGVAASMGAQIAIAKGTMLVMTKLSRLMFHNASNVVAGDSVDLRTAADLMDGYQSDMVDMLAERTGLSVADTTAQYYQKGVDKWLTAQQAKDAGIAHQVVSGRITKGASASLIKAGNMDNILQHFAAQLTDSTTQDKMKDSHVALLIVALGLSTDATPEQVIKAAQAQTEKVVKLEASLKSSVDAAKELKEFKATAEEQEVTDLIAKAKADGKIKESQVEQFTASARKDFGLVKSMLETTAAHQTITSKLEDGTVGDIKANAKYEGWSFRDFQMKDGQELERIQNEEPDRFAEMKAIYLKGRSRK